MLRLFNSLGEKLEVFKPVSERVVTLFTCGPSIYQRAHIGNFRTFLFEDILVRYLEYLGSRVERGMNFTDIEDKAIKEALKRGVSVEKLTEENIDGFLSELRLLRMKTPDYLPRASDYVEQSVAMIEHLLEIEVAYRHRSNIYFDPLKFPGFGKLYRLDMNRWPTRKTRFHRDTYPGTHWNYGDFILWHGYREGDTVFWDTTLGKGRPSWNIQDPSMVGSHFQETLSIYCGGIDNLYRHHDYSLAILESLRPYPMARFWLHSHHLLVGGRKMSKSRGNVYYADDLLDQEYSAAEIRFFLIYGHYRENLSFSGRNMQSAAEKLKRFREKVREIEKKADASTPLEDARARGIREAFKGHMDRDLDLHSAFDGLSREIEALTNGDIKPAAAAAVISVLKEIDGVLCVIF